MGFITIYFLVKDHLMAFTQLHVHTDQSRRDGLGTPRALLSHAKSLGYNAIGLTDHGTLSGSATFAKLCDELGLKGVIGMEGYIAHDNEIGHITLFADGMKGWQSLVNLNNIAQANRQYKNPTFNIDELTQNASGLVCLTGCIDSPFNTLSINDSLQLGRRLKKVFDNRLFAELMFVGDQFSQSWERPLILSERLGIKPVITNDVHFPKQEQAESHQILTKIKSGFSYDSSQLWLKSHDEMLQAGINAGLSKTDVLEYMKRAYNIGHLIKPVKLKHDPILPHLDFNVTLRDLVFHKTERSVMLNDPVYRERAEYELTVLGNLGYDDYFLILNDIIWKAKELDILIGHGRGSGAGSLVLYILGITNIDPIKHGLIFERFLNPYRQSMPDVDIDIQSSKRDLLLDYAANKFGAIPIATYSTFGHSSLVRDLCRFFRVSKELTEIWADNEDRFLRDTDANEEHKQLRNAYNAFIGQIRHKSKHAGGVVLDSGIPMPLERVGDQLALGWSEGKEASAGYAGLVKFDFLGLNALDIFAMLRDLTGVLPEEPTDNNPAFEIFKSGNLGGIFQFSGSYGIRQLTVRLQPNTFGDLVAINALYRPGALGSGAADQYPEWKKEPRLIDPLVDDILAETFGAIVYQEQVMSITKKVIGGSDAEADNVRRIISKPTKDNKQALNELKERFIKAGTEKMNKAKAELLWSEIETHSKYSFNKSHSTAYSLLAWEMAWYKYYYPIDFYTTLLTFDPDNNQSYIMEALRAGINIETPHVNKSKAVWTNDGKTIYMPISSIKYLGKTGTVALIKERESKGEFTSIKNFMDRVPKSAVRGQARQRLYYMGGFSGLEGYFEQLSIKEMLEQDKKDLQIESFGFILLSVLDAKWMLEQEKEGYLCGIVENEDKRQKRHGRRLSKYRVYRLSPEGIFWTNQTTLKINELVAVKISDKGKLLEAKIKR